MSYNIFQFIENNLGFSVEKARRLINFTELSTIFLKNKLNKTLFNSKCGNLFKEGNVVQICSKSSNKAIQICSSKENPKKLIFVANGSIINSVDYTPNPSTHFFIEKDSDGLVSFKNKNLFYLNFCDCYKRNNSVYKQILDDTKFVVHEVLGSDELFSLESVKYKGRFLASHPDGTTTTCRNNREEIAHFFLNIINVPDID